MRNLFSTPLHAHGLLLGRRKVLLGCGALLLVGAAGCGDATSSNKQSSAKHSMHLNKIVHPWFGELNASAIDEVDVVWERTIPLRGVEVDLSLWAGSTTRFDTVNLDALAAQLQSLDRLDAQARKALLSHLTVNRDFIDEHIDVLASHPAIQRVLAASSEPAVQVAAFVAELNLQKVGIWLTGVTSELKADSDPSSRRIIADYMLDPESSDQILAVKMDLSGQVIEVNWES